MGLENLQSLHFMAPHLPSSYKRDLCSRSHLLPSSRSRKHRSSTFGLARPSTLFGSCSNGKGFGLKRSCSSGSNEYLSKEFLKNLEYLSQNYYVMDDDDDDYSSLDAAYAAAEISCTSTANVGKREGNKDPSLSFLPSKFELLEPNILGIQPEPPEWPERDEMLRSCFEHRANIVGTPFSVRMIKRKQKWQESFGDAGDFAYCSVRKAFSSMVFILRELHNQAVCIRGSLYREDLQEVTNTIQMEMNASFVWLFQQVFSQTPGLMVCLMLLLANFSAHAIVGNNDIPGSSSHLYNHEKISETVLTSDQMNSELSNFDHSIGINNGSGGTVDEVSAASKSKDLHVGRISSVQSQNVACDALDKFTLPGNLGLNQEEEAELCDSVASGDSVIEAESRSEVFDLESLQRFILPLSVELEPDDYVEYHRTDLRYQMVVAGDPNNCLVLSNYAQFLFLVSRDYDRAEACFKRAIMVEPPDAEALCRYADFLCIVRKDLWGAEERYLQAVAAEPDSTYYASKYASFLWSTGGEDTCFPLNTSTDNYYEVL